MDDTARYYFPISQAMPYQGLGELLKKTQCVSQHSQESRITIFPTDDGLTYNPGLLGSNFIISQRIYMCICACSLLAQMIMKFKKSYHFLEKVFFHLFI